MMSSKQTQAGNPFKGFFWMAIFLLTMVPVAMSQSSGSSGAPVGGSGGPPEGSDGPAGNPGPGIEALHPKLLRELNLTPEQQKKFKAARLAVQKQKIQLQSEKAISELDLKNALTAYPVNKEEAMKAGEKVADADRKLTLLKVESWSQFQAGLTAEQHHKLMDIQADLHARRKAWREDFKNQRRESKREEKRDAKREEKREERGESKHKGRADR